eukprot:SAG31_NODE_8563_length_1430_cov_1.311796_2_plen_211_part_00
MMDRRRSAAPSPADGPSPIFTPPSPPSTQRRRPRCLSAKPSGLSHSRSEQNVARTLQFPAPQQLTISFSSSHTASSEAGAACPRTPVRSGDTPCDPLAVPCRFRAASAAEPHQCTCEGIGGSRATAVHRNAMGIKTVSPSWPWPRGVNTAWQTIDRKLITQITKLLGDADAVRAAGACAHWRKTILASFKVNAEWEVRFRGCSWLLEVVQ